MPDATREAYRRLADAIVSVCSEPEDESVDEDHPGTTRRRMGCTADFGCGAGFIATRLTELGICTHGFDGEEHLAAADDAGRVNLYQVDPKVPFWLHGFDFVICTEAPDRLGPEHADTLIATLTACQPSTILWAASFDDDLSCVRKLEAKGYAIDAIASIQLRTKMLLAKTQHSDRVSDFFLLNRKATATMGDSILITREGENFAARIDGIAACGTGQTEAQAIRSLCDLLGDFVKGHAHTIDTIRAALRSLADPSPELVG